MVKATVLASLAVAANAWSLAPRQSSSKTPPISVKGNAFVRPDGTRFIIRGVDYQPSGASNPQDPISDANGCKRDIKYFQQLGINTIRVYSVDNTAQHDECMQALSDAGIYLALDVNSKGYSINRDEPKLSYNDVYLQSVFATIDAFKGYDNTLLFFSGNEVINDATNTNTAPYIKAVTRDMKAYIKAQSKRPIPVGYSAADVVQNRLQTAHYMNCGPDSVRADLFAFNDYEWCGQASSFQTSGWADNVKAFGDYSLPLFLSEYGCNKNPPRTFPEVAALYSDKMWPVYSGGLVYEFTQEESHYGLVDASSDPPKELVDFKNLANQFKQNPIPNNPPIGNTNGQASQCPPHDPIWQPGMPDNTLPAMPKPAQQFMLKGAGPGPGLKGSSQSTGTGSTANATISNTDSSSGSSTSSGAGADASGSAGAAAGLQPISLGFGPFATGLVVLASSVVGAVLL